MERIVQVVFDLLQLRYDRRL